MYSLSQKIIAWSVHIFTSLGLCCAFMALIAIDEKAWATSFLWLIACFVIDSLDGTFARLGKVEEVLPGMDGKIIDFVIDFFTYAIIPTYFFYKADMAPKGLEVILIGTMLLSSALYYGKKEMVEDGQYFIGFPVLWNIVVFYQFFIFNNNLTVNAISVFIIGILHFVPLKYAYPSRSKKYMLSHVLFSVVGLGSSVYLLYTFPEALLPLQVLSVAAGVYFCGFAIKDTFINRT